MIPEPDTSPAVSISGVAAGGDGVGRLPDERVVFVRGAVPGDRVRVQVHDERARFARATVLEVLEPGPGRVTPPCPLVAEGCGGCGWQHVAPAHQLALKETIVADALERIGRLPPADIPPLASGAAMATTGFRTTVRAAVRDGRAALRVAHGHATVDLGATGCLVAHPLVDEVLRHGRFGTAEEATVRAGAATGERLVLLSGKGAGDDVEVPEGVVVVTAAELRAGRRAWLHEVVAGRRWRISAGSFFQTRPDGADALARTVAAAAAEHLADGRGHVVDLYGGVGLLAGAVADTAKVPVKVLLVEANRSAVADARVNLADLDGTRIVRADVRRWRPDPCDLVIADPSRHGLGAEVVARVVATGADAAVLVSCDPGALGRDAGDLHRSGYRLVAVQLLDLFGHTPHVEVVTTWRRSAAAPA